MREQAEKRGAGSVRGRRSPASNPVSNHAEQAVRLSTRMHRRPRQSAPAQPVAQRGLCETGAYHSGLRPADEPAALCSPCESGCLRPAEPAGGAAPREEPVRGREDHYLQVRNPWAPAETREPAPVRHGFQPADRAMRRRKRWYHRRRKIRLQASRDRLTSRWFALNGRVLRAPRRPAEAVPAAAPQRAPVLAVFSLAGGVGKTSLVATLGRALSARGERVLLVDTAAFGLLPFFFGARDQRPGVLRTFTAPGDQRRCAGPDDHGGSGIAGSGNRSAGKPHRRRFRGMPAARAG